MADRTRRELLTAAGFAACVALPSPVLAAELSPVERLKELVAEICQAPGAPRDALDAFRPVLERMGQVAISKHLIEEAIEAIGYLYDPGDAWPTLQPLIRKSSAHVATRLKWATGAVKPPLRDGPGSDV